VLGTRFSYRKWQKCIRLQEQHVKWIATNFIWFKIPSESLLRLLRKLWDWRFKSQLKLFLKDQL